MPIQVTCPNCFKRFQVSDKFAGKKGPCPGCKSTIAVPDKSEEVVIHAPDDGAPKDRKGVSVLKPIKRTETDVTRKGLAITISAVVAALAIAIGLRLFSGEEGPPLIAQIIGLIVIAPPLVRWGYSFVYDQELEPYTGIELRNRVLICSALYASLWIIYAFVPTYVFDLEKASEMNYMTFGIILCVMLGVGTFIAMNTFEVEMLGGLTHAGLYLLSAILLALIAGVTLAGVESQEDARLREAGLAMQVRWDDRPYDS
ncbi:signal peptide protein [Rhodopirellula maiorica SM1]|uniref:Signal peptide protein n=1 Tax=Rhodopirellula maiorica SM1 TaxID=1265738 RepID=M5S1Q7_9BACT|nr:hypothetical protein [Rhodopirellula maiorica]EMI21587.1 signal peptide protein [Rhodopirellula maiorica SM1]